MSGTSLKARLSDAMAEAGVSSAELARLASTTEATISNWLNDNVQVDHVKAVILLRISHALGVLPGWLLLNEGARSPGLRISEPAPEQSHTVKTDVLTIAIQLVGKTLDDKDLILPPSKHAELTALVYDLLIEGMPEAKVLRFARVAAA